MASSLHMVLIALVVANTLVATFVVFQVARFQNNADDTILTLAQSGSSFVYGVEDGAFKTLERESTVCGERPLWGLIADVAIGTVKQSKDAIAESIILVTTTGFFPSNVIQTLDAMINYDYTVTAYVLNQAFYGLAEAYFNRYKQTGAYEYIDVGSQFMVMSQVAGQVSSVPPMPGSKTTIPPQDSWLATVVLTLPNITAQTFGNSTVWTKSFGDLSTLAGRFAGQKWSGSYNGYGGQEHSWSCYDCHRDFQSISKQASIIATAPHYVSTSSSSSSSSVQARETMTASH